MPTARVTLADGSQVTVTGSAEELAAVLKRIGGAAPGHVTPSQTGAPKPPNSANRPRTRTASHGAVADIRELIGANFFSGKRGLRDVQRELEASAHIYPITTLSPALFRLVRSKELRRLKEGGTWKYVNR
jgi:hypothetical protein